jgi:MFS family permease
MQAHGHLFSDTALVIQWHLLGMFVPSFFTGYLIKKFGIPQVMIAGAISLLICAAVNLMGTSVLFFWLALVLLGVGWNFLFIGSTTLLTHVYTLSEKAKTQGINDFLVFGTVSITALISGWLHHLFGWQTINWGVIPVVLIALSASIWLRSYSAQKAYA